MRGRLLRHSGRDVAPLSQPPVDLGPYEGMEGQHDWTGLWQLDRRDMRWKRDQHYYFRGVLTGIVGQGTQLGWGPALRPGPLAKVGLLNVQLAVFRSHPETPNVLPEELEGMWTDTNPAWPEETARVMLGKYGLEAALKDSAEAAITETFDLIPDFAEGVNPDEAEPLDRTPLTLSAVLVYAMASSRAA
ncbi:MAG TPA: hypothetical protein VIH90_00695 [Candidatus Saccharimonadales bacterium]